MSFVVRLLYAGLLAGLVFIILASAKLSADEGENKGVDTVTENTGLTDTQHIVEVGQWHISLAVGLGKRNALVVDQDDFTFYLAPNIAYYNEQFFFDNGTLGYTLAEQPNYAISLISELNPHAKYFDTSNIANLIFPIGGGSSSSFDDPVESGDESPSSPTAGDDLGSEQGDGSDVPTDDEPATDNPSQETPDNGGSNGDGSKGGGQGSDYDPKVIAEALEERSWSIDAGLQLNYFMSDRQQVEIKLVKDITGVHQGWRITSHWSLRINSWLPSDLTGRFGVGLSWLDKKNSNYYYGHDSGHSQLDYELGSQLIPSVSMTLKKPLSNKLQAILHYKHQRLPSGIANSPVTVTSDINTAFIGVSYAF